MKLGVRVLGRKDDDEEEEERSVTERGDGKGASFAPVILSWGRPGLLRMSGLLEGGVVRGTMMGARRVAPPRAWDTLPPARADAEVDGEERGERETEERAVVEVVEVGCWRIICAYTGREGT